MNRKKMPLFLMLVAGAIVWIITFIRQYEMLDSMLAVFLSLVIFYSLGSIMRWILDKFEEQNEKLRQELAEAAKGEEENTETEQVAVEA